MTCDETHARTTRRLGAPKGMPSVGRASARKARATELWSTATAAALAIILLNASATAQAGGRTDTGTDRHISIAQNAIVDPQSAYTSTEADAFPPLPLPHPKRASKERRAAHAAMLATWPPRDRHAAALDRKLQRGAASSVPVPSPNAERSAPIGATDSSRSVNTAPDIGSASAKRSETAGGSSSSGSVSPDPTAPPTTNGAAQTGDSTSATAMPEVWSAAEVAEAEQLCERLLDSIAAETDRLAPLRKGSCGAPVPVRLRRVGSGTGMTIQPAATTNCAVTARLHQWLETVAQPAAKRVFGSQIVKVRNASSYMCRNRYNDPAAKISEHAFANALDLAAFELADGRTIDVQRYWGSVVESAEAARAAQAAGATITTTTTDPARPSNLGRRALTNGITEAKAETPARSKEPGGSETAELAFLKELHTGACGIFSTVLGPEANRAHHDHFHFDLKQRRGAAFCE